MILIPKYPGFHDTDANIPCKLEKFKLAIKSDELGLPGLFSKTFLTPIKKESLLFQFGN